MSFHTRLIAIKRFASGRTGWLRRNLALSRDMDVGWRRPAMAMVIRATRHRGTPVLINHRGGIGRPSVDGHDHAGPAPASRGTDRRSGAVVGRRFAGGADCPGCRHDFHTLLWCHGTVRREVLPVASVDG